MVVPENRELWKACVQLEGKVWRLQFNVARLLSYPLGRNQRRSFSRKTCIVTGLLR